MFFSWHSFARSWLEQGFRLNAPKNLDFGCRIPDFVNYPFVALGEAVDFAPSDLFCDFSFARNGCFRKKKKRRTRQKFFPLPTVGAPSASNSPSALRAGWIKANKVCRIKLQWQYDRKKLVKVSKKCIAKEKFYQCDTQIKKGNFLLFRLQLENEERYCDGEMTSLSSPG